LYSNFSNSNPEHIKKELMEVKALQLLVEAECKHCGSDMEDLDAQRVYCVGCGRIYKVLVVFAQDDSFSVNIQIIGEEDEDE